jgi:hypothetical protein
VITGCEELPTQPEGSTFDPSTALDPKRLSPDDREAVILEALISLRPDLYCSDRPYKAINGMAVSEYNYLEGDGPAYADLRNQYGTGYASLRPEWAFYTNIHVYGLYGGYGRGGQCAYFANLILYRSGVYRRKFPTYALCYNDFNGARRYTKAVRDLKPGDVIRTKTANGHTAIVIAILSRNSDGSVKAVDVIDSNFVSWPNTSKQEIIGRHPLTRGDSRGGVQDLNNYYGLDLIKLVANT